MSETVSDPSLCVAECDAILTSRPTDTGGVRMLGLLKPVGSLSVVLCSLATFVATPASAEAIRLTVYFDVC